LVSVEGLGQEGESKTQARELARETGRLLDDGQYRRALEQVERAEQLYHAPTHLQMKAEALEGLGRLAEAMSVYERLSVEPLEPAASDAFRRAIEHAEDRLSALGRVVPALSLRLTGAEASAVRITVDGEAVSLSSMPLRLDAGDHVLVAEAVGFERFERSLSLRSDGAVEVVEVAMSVVAPPNEQDRAPVESDHGASDSTGGSLVPAVVALGIGGAALSIGAVTGGISLVQVSDLRGACPGQRCTEAHRGTIEEIETLGNVSTAAFVVGGVGVATGIVMLFARPGGGQETALTPLLGPGALGLQGRF